MTTINRTPYMLHEPVTTRKIEFPGAYPMPTNKPHYFPMHGRWYVAIYGVVAPWRSLK